MNTMTERQATFLKTLVEERDTEDSEPFLEVLRQHYREGRATSQEASAVISGLLASPKRDRHSLRAGIYHLPDTDRLVRVYLGQNSGHMLAKEVILTEGCPVEYVYLGRASANIPTTARRFSREEVAERTLTTGSTSCMVCGRALDNPESVDRGIGPVCWENYA